MVSMKCGWRAESQYGVDPLGATDDYVYFFGDYKPEHDIPQPWHDIPCTPVFRLGNTAPVGLIEGAKDVVFTLRFCPLAADEWKYLLGTVTGGNTFTNLAAGGAMPSRTIYFETPWGDIVVAKGCVVQEFDFFADRVRDTLTEMEVTFMAAEVAEHAELVPSSGSSPRYHASLGITSAWTWAHMNACQLDQTTMIGDAGEIDRIHVRGVNQLAVRKSTKAIQVKKVGFAVEIDFDIPVKATTQLVLRAIRDGTVDEFYYKWLRSAYYWELSANNIKFRKLRAHQRVYPAAQPVYTIGGSACYDSTNTGYEEALKFKAVDGVTYS